MNPPAFFGSKVDEDPQGFTDEVLRVSPQEKVELATYQLKYVAQVWYEQLKEDDL